MKLDLLATESHFIDHLVPIWCALPDDLRGTFMVPTSLGSVLRSFGIPSSGASDGDAVLVASRGDHKRARSMRRALIARIEHGMGQSYGTQHPSYAGGRDCDDVGLWLVPNRYAAELWRSMYPQARVEIVGCPKLDDLPAFEPTDPPTVVASFHWDGQSAPEAGSAFGDFADALLGLRDQSYRLALHSHPRNARAISRWAMRHALPYIDAFGEVLRTAALYVFDNTSSGYEFAATGRPVVVLNASTYRRHVHHGLRFWETADVGVQVDRPDELRGAITEALSDPPARQRMREAALDVVYAHRGDSTRRAVEALTSWLAQREEMAA